MPSGSENRSWASETRRFSLSSLFCHWETTGLQRSSIAPGVRQTRKANPYFVEDCSQGCMAVSTKEDTLLIYNSRHFPPNLSTLPCKHPEFGFPLQQYGGEQAMDWLIRCSDSYPRSSHRSRSVRYNSNRINHFSKGRWRETRGAEVETAMATPILEFVLGSYIPVFSLSGMDTSHKQPLLTANFQGSEMGDSRVALCWVRTHPATASSSKMTIQGGQRWGVLMQFGRR